VRAHEEVRLSRVLKPEEVRISYLTLNLKAAFPSLALNISSQSWREQGVWRHTERLVVLLDDFYFSVTLLAAVFATAEGSYDLGI